MSARKARTEAAAAAASADSEEKDVKIPVEAADEATEATENTAGAPSAEAPQADAAAEASDEGAATTDDPTAGMTEEEMIEAAIRAGEEAAENDFKLKYEQASSELVDVRRQLSEAEEALKAADTRSRDAQDRVQRLQADWENFRRRTAQERLAEQSRATEKLVSALLPVIDDMERAIAHAGAEELDDSF